jgi:hypothetical protein
MSSFRWPDRHWGDPTQESHYDRVSIFSANPAPDGILFTTFAHMLDKRTQEKFCSSESAIFLDEEQIRELTQLLIIFLKEVQDARDRRDLPGHNEHGTKL